MDKQVYNTFMSAARILLVDDHRQISRMLRSSLELSGKEFIVIDVPSGEEALLEIARGPIDLLVTDLRLPGITGLELIAKARKLNPRLQSVMITGHPTEQARTRAAELGVIGFLSKPVGTNMFLEMVERALQTSSKHSNETSFEEQQADATQILLEQLLNIERNIGAEAVLLVNHEGRIEAGNLPSEIDLAVSLPAIMSVFKSSLQVSAQLGRNLPTNYHFFEGEDFQIYFTNMDERHGLLVLFRGPHEPGRMGAVVHYTDQSVQKIITLLPEPLSQIDEALEAELPWEDPDHSVDDLSEITLETVTDQVEQLDPELFWEDAVSGSAGQAAMDRDALSYEQARKLGLVEEDPEGQKDANPDQEG
jgi:DNA-binding NarL/FixJ family response regulator